MQRFLLDMYIMMNWSKLIIQNYEKSVGRNSLAIFRKPFVNLDPGLYN